MIDYEALNVMKICIQISLISSTYSIKIIKFSPYPHQSSSL